MSNSILCSYTFLLFWTGPIQSISRFASIIFFLLTISWSASISFLLQSAGRLQSVNSYNHMICFNQLINRFNQLITFQQLIGSNLLVVLKSANHYSSAWLCVLRYGWGCWLRRPTPTYGRRWRREAATPHQTKSYQPYHTKLPPQKSAHFSLSNHTGKNIYQVEDSWRRKVPICQWNSCEKGQCHEILSLRYFRIIFRFKEVWWSKGGVVV